MFLEKFGFQPHTLINFVGGGGKTALIHKLIDEYCSQGTVLYTTTTRIHPPDPNDGMVVISCENIELLRTIVDKVSLDCSSQHYKLIVTRHFITPDLLLGVPPDFLNQFERKRFPMLFNEADGAASFSIKLPRVGEPVLMQHAEYLVPVIGLDCLNQPLGSEVVFRFRLFAEKYQLKAGEPLTPEIAAQILMHKEGVCKGWTPAMKIIPFKNKVDALEQEASARYLAELIMRNPNFPVERVVFGSVMNGRIEEMH